MARTSGATAEEAARIGEGHILPGARIIRVVGVAMRPSTSNKALVECVEAAGPCVGRQARQRGKVLRPRHSGERGKTRVKACPRPSGHPGMLSLPHCSASTQYDSSTRSLSGWRPWAWRRQRKVRPAWGEKSAFGCDRDEAAVRLAGDRGRGDHDDYFRGRQS